MLFSESNQEAYDNLLMAHRIAEHKDVLLPLMVCQDGFITSHSIETIDLVEDDKVKDFVGTYKPEHYLLNSKEPISMGPLDLQGYLFEHKAQQSQAMKNAKKVILEVADEFEKLTGRKYGLFEEYKLEDADVAIVCMNSTAGTAKFVVDDLRSKGIKAGLLKVRVFRPFPAEEIAKALANVKAVAVLDKADSLNAAGGALFTDVTSGMYVNNIHVPTVSYIYGIGGRDTKSDDIEKVYNDLLGHRMCAGCGAPPVARMVLRALKPEDHAVIATATGCMEVSTFTYPYTSWTDSFIHTAFENAGSTLSGVEAAYKSLKKQGKLEEDTHTKFIAFGGDGGTYDIGLQSLSGAMERGHDMVYVCYDNGAYMNTGIQRSSATPKFADTTTSPAGTVIPGKAQERKDLTEIMVSHHLPYVAQTLAMTNFKDLYEKAEKAIYTEGPTFLNVMAPCPRGWGYPTEDLMQINKLAADTCYWPLYEVVDGKYKITYKPAKKLPVEEFLKPQKRFRHMFKPGNEWMIEEFQRIVDKRWNELLQLEEMTNKE